MTRHPDEPNERDLVLGYTCLVVAWLMDTFGYLILRNL